MGIEAVEGAIDLCNGIRNRRRRNLGWKIMLLQGKKLGNAMIENLPLIYLFAIIEQYKLHLKLLQDFGMWRDNRKSIQYIENMFNISSVYSSKKMGRIIYIRCSSSNNMSN